MAALNLTIAEQRVVAAEVRVARQRELIGALRRNGHEAAAQRAVVILGTLETNLELARQHLALSRALPGQPAAVVRP